MARAQLAPRIAQRGAHRPRDYKRAGAAFCLAVSLTVTCGSARGAAEPAFTQQVEARVLVLVNEFRAEHGLERIEREARLDATARYSAGYMAKSGRLDHDADGSTPAKRVSDRGYRYCVLAENIAYEHHSRGFSVERLARNLVEGWRESPTHRANMLDSAVTQTGIGVTSTTRGEYYAAQLFARPMVQKARGKAACTR